MKAYARYFLIVILLHSTCLFAQKHSALSIDKINGSYHKTLTLPVRTRIVTHDEEVMLLRLDSITNGYFYGNQGKDSIAVNDIATVNLRGTKEAIKYAGIAVCAVSVLQAIPITTFGLYRYPDYKSFVYIGMAQVVTWASLGTFIYFHPRTRFHIAEYKLHTY